MRIQAYTAYSGLLVITAATLRPEGAPSMRFTAASIHEDYCAAVRASLEEYLHIAPTSAACPAVKRLDTYLPTTGTPARPLYAIRKLLPAGAPRSIDAEFMLELMSIRYDFELNLLPAAFTANQIDRNAIERHLTAAVKALLVALDIRAPGQTFQPGDNEPRPLQPGATEVDIVCELGPATARTGADIPDPATG